MSEIPGDLKFQKSHEWARVEGDGRVTIGISDHAQGLLGDLVYVELPDAEGAALHGPGREEFFIEHHHVFSAASTASFGC